MKNLKTFPKGGVHPADNKALAAEEAIRQAALPAACVVPMSQHLGKPSECSVEPGDTVEVGAVIGTSTGFISAVVHSPVKGTVKELTNIHLPNGQKTRAVVIEPDEESGRGGDFPSSDGWKNKSESELLDILASRGIVGLGGATFPANVKFTVPKGSKVEYFVVNGVECEPYLTADYRLMMEKTENILGGIDVVRSILHPDHIVIGIENNKPAAIEKMRAAVSRLDYPVEVVPLKVKYPQGDEKQLLKAVTGREVPSGGLPIAIGAVVSNVGTLNAVYEAAVCDKPLIERVVTVSGRGVKKPSNLLARVGTPIGNLIDECGGLQGNTVKIISGGPMMGFAVSDIDTPVTKGTSGILVLTDRETGTKPATPCLQCGRCVKACPMGLNPTRLYKWIDHMEYDAAVDEGLMDCKECGCCAWSCPARIPLVQGMKLGKLMIRKKKAN